MTYRERIGRFVEGPPFQRLIMTLIVLNAVTLGLETAPSIAEPFGHWLEVFDAAVLAVFVLEIGGKLAYRRLAFFRDGWNVFDFVIVGIALIPASGDLAVLRALRILRTLRLISVVPQMRRVVQALLTAVPGIASVGAIISLFFYVGAVLTTKLYAETFPEWFGTIGRSMYSLFQIMTLESWSMGIVRPVMVEHPWAWVFFVPFILILSFAILNLFIGIIVDAMQTQHEAERELAQAEAESLHGDSERELLEVGRLRDEIAGLRNDIADLRRQLGDSRDG